MAEELRAPNVAEVSALGSVRLRQPWRMTPSCYARDAGFHSVLGRQQMRRAMVIAVLLALCGCGKSYEEALAYCTKNVAKVFPRADQQEASDLIRMCMISEGYE